MATESITQFPALPAGQVSGNDLLPIVDVSDLTSPTGTTKKTLISSIQQGQNAFNSVFNVKSPIYGAVGNGVTDDTAAFHAAIAAAAAVGGGIVFLPAGEYAITDQLVLPGGVSLIGTGCGYNASPVTCRILWNGASGFCVKAGNTADTLSYGIEVANFSIATTATNSGLWLYGVTRCLIQNIAIEGVLGTTTTIGMQIDGADISAFFITLQNVSCNHVFKGFVHTTTGSVQPTQVTAVTCTAQCDDTVGSMGIDVQVVDGLGCGDGVLYLGGNVEHCKTGVHLAASGTTIVGMRCENPAGSSDITFASTARCNQIIGGSNVVTITDDAGSRTNQVVAVPQNESTVVSQPNILDDLRIGQDIGFRPKGPTGDDPHYVFTDAGASYAGTTIVQAGNGGAGAGGAMNLYGHAHVTHPGDVVAGISAGSGGKFRVNSQALDAGSDYLVVDEDGLTVATVILMRTTTALTNGAAAQIGTLTNAPVAGNPTKWVPINDNGTTRYIPAW